MTLQSSFLIRCTLSAGGESTRAYYIQHVQTGAEFRCTTLDCLTAWMTEQNSRFVAETLKGISAEEAQ